MIPSDTIDGQLLGDYLRATSRATSRVAFAVTGDKGSGRSTALKRFLSGCLAHSLSVSKISPLESSTADVLYGDYYSLTEAAVGSSMPVLPTKRCLVLDDLHIWVQLRRLNGKDYTMLDRWPGHLVLSCLAMDNIPPNIAAAFVLVEYPLIVTPQFVMRQLLLSHPTASQTACSHLSLQTPKLTSAADVLTFISNARASSVLNPDGKTVEEKALAFEAAYLAAVGTSTKRSMAPLPILPPSLATLHERMKILLGQYLAHFGLAEATGPIARASSSTTGILLSGMSGSGKTLLTHALEAAFPSIPFLRVGCHEFFGKYLGESEERLRDFFKRARKLAPCVAVMEDVDVIAQRRSGGDAESSSVAKRMLTAFLCEMDGVEDTSGVMAIGTTSAVGTVDGALLRQGRLETVLEMPCLTSADVSALMDGRHELMLEAKVDRTIVGHKLTGKPFSSFSKAVQEWVELTIQ